MFGILIATILGLFGYVFRQKNFYECYLSSTMFLIWWSAGEGVLFFILNRLITNKAGFARYIFHLPRVSERLIFRLEILYYFISVISVVASYLLHSSLDLAEGIHYWNSSRLIAGISIYSMAILLIYFEKVLTLVLEE